MRYIIYTPLALLLLGCDGKPALRKLDPASYASYHLCWEADRNTLEAFAIFDPVGSTGYTPSFISYRCIPRDEVFGDLGAYLANLTAFRVEKSSTNLRKFGFSSGTIFNNDPVEFSIPGDDKKVYFIRAKFHQEGHKKYIEKFDLVKDTKLPFGEFLKLTENQMSDLGKELSN